MKILITGATDGLGKGLALALARDGATLFLHGRDDARGEATITEIGTETGNDKLSFHCADFVLHARGRATSTLAEGMDWTLRLIVAPELDRVTGRYFNGTRDARADAQAYDVEARRRLRELSERLVGRWLS